MRVELTETEVDTVLSACNMLFPASVMKANLRAGGCLVLDQDNITVFYKDGKYYATMDDANS